MNEKNYNKCKARNGFIYTKLTECEVVDKWSEKLFFLLLFWFSNYVHVNYWANKGKPKANRIKKQRTMFWIESNENTKPNYRQTESKLGCVCEETETEGALKNVWNEIKNENKWTKFIKKKIPTKMDRVREYFRFSFYKCWHVNVCICKKIVTTCCLRFFCWSFCCSPGSVSIDRRWRCVAMGNSSNSRSTQWTKKFSQENVCFPMMRWSV